MFFFKVIQLLEDTVSSCSISAFFMLLVIFTDPGHVLPHLSYLASFEFLAVLQYFKTVSKSVPSFYWMKTVLLLGPHTNCHFLRAVINSSFFWVLESKKIFQIIRICIN